MTHRALDIAAFRRVHRARDRKRARGAARFAALPARFAVFPARFAFARARPGGRRNARAARLVATHRGGLAGLAAGSCILVLRRRVGAATASERG